MVNLNEAPQWSTIPRPRLSRRGTSKRIAWCAAPVVAVTVPQAGEPLCCGTGHSVPAVPQAAEDIEREYRVVRTPVMLERLNTLNASQMNCMRTRSLNRTPSLLGLLEESLKALEAEHKFLLKGDSLQRGCHPTLE